MLSAACWTVPATSPPIWSRVSATGWSFEHNRAAPHHATPLHLRSSRRALETWLGGGHLFLVAVVIAACSQVGDMHTSVGTFQEWAAIRWVPTMRTPLIQSALRPISSSRLALGCGYVTEHACSSCADRIERRAPNSPKRRRRLALIEACFVPSCTAWQFGGPLARHLRRPAQRDGLAAGRERGASLRRLFTV